MSTASDNWIPRHRLTVDEYYRMAEVGLLAPDARVELIEGEIIDRPPIGSPHAAVVTKLTQLLMRAVGDRAIVRVQQPVRLDRRSEPQPDLSILAPRADFYAAGHPGSGNILLLVEVSATTLRFDREVKLPLYARHRIPEVWIVDLEGKTLFCHRSPAGKTYADVSSTLSPSVVALSALPEERVDLTSLFAGL